MQLDVIEVVTALARLTKVQSSVPIVSAVSDMMRHLRKSIHYSLDDANLGDQVINWNRKFHQVVDECLTELSSKVGDAGQILDVMASMLENISSITVIARTTISAVYRTARIVASLPNLSYKNKAFPEALFHQLLPSMVHPDHQTRIGAHKIFSVVLVPSSVCPQPSSEPFDANKNIDFARSLSRSVSVFSSSAALFRKLQNQRTPSKENFLESNNGNETGGMVNKIKSTYSRVYSLRSSPALDVDNANNSSKDADTARLRLSSHQITLLLSSIWTQSVSPENMPENYEAIANTYSLVLLFSRAKTSYRDALIRSFQLAFTLRSISLKEGSLLPSRRRSLFVLSSCMIIFSSKVFNILSIIPVVKASISDKAVDPYLSLVEDSKLQSSDDGLEKQNGYGSKDDNNSALKSLSAIKIENELTKKSLVSFIVKDLDNALEYEEAATREQLLQDFVPDDSCSLGVHMYTNPPEEARESNVRESNVRGLDKITLGIEDDSAEGGIPTSKLTIEFPNLLSVDQLLQSILETAHHVGRVSVSTAPESSYKDVANHCESLQQGKQQKMTLLTLASRNASGGVDKSYGGIPSGLPKGETSGKQLNGPQVLCPAEYQNNPVSFRLPTSSPYDNFLKAAGC